MGEYIEYYVTCNPPLLPRGVSQVIRSVREVEGLCEVLFEPHVPWFKCISLRDVKEHICTVIHDSLCMIADEDADTFDPEQNSDGDISIISPNSRVIQWSVYQQESNKYAFADDDIFPEVILSLKYKAVWRGLESSSHLDFQSLLASYYKNSDPKALEKHHEEFEAETKCQILRNMRQTVLYIGTDESQRALNAVRKKLDTLVHIHNNTSLVGHRVVLDSEDSPYLTYKWLSHLGLHRSTYLPYNPCTASHNHSILMKAATIRTKHLKAYGGWIPERQVTPMRTKAAECAKSHSTIRNFNYKTSLDKALHVPDPEFPTGDPINSGDLLLDTGSSQVELLDWDLLGDIPCDSKAIAEASTLQPTCQPSPPIFDGEDLISFSLLDVVDESALAEPLPDEPRKDCFAVAEDITKPNAAQKEPLKSPRNAKFEYRSKSHVKTQVKEDPITTRIPSVKNYLQVVIGGFTQIPGHLSIRLVFGRVFLTQFPAQLVDLYQNLDHSLAAVEDHLNKMRSSEIGFSSILSAKEEETHSLAALVSSSAEGWTLSEIKVFYDLHCSFGGNVAECDVLEINPENKTACRSAFVDCFSLYLHFPKHLWDLKLTGTKYDDITESKRSWIEDWLKSVKISKLAKSGLKFEFLDCSGSAATVKGIVIRHVLVYKQPNSDMYLSISFSRKLNRTSADRQISGPMVPVTWQTPKARQSSKLTPDEWVEAQLGSSIVDAWLEAQSQQNNGDYSHNASGEECSKEPIARLVKMTNYASNMVAQMEGIGRDNNNGQNLDIKAVTQPGPSSHGHGMDAGEYTQFW